MKNPLPFPTAFVRTSKMPWYCFCLNIAAACTNWFSWNSVYESSTYSAHSDWSGSIGVGCCSVTSLSALTSPFPSLSASPPAKPFSWVLRRRPWLRVKGEVEAERDGIEQQLMPMLPDQSECAE